MWVVLLEVLGERECNHRESGVVISAIVTFFVRLLALLVLVVSLLSVDVADL